MVKVKIKGKPKVRAESGRPAGVMAGLHKVNVRVKVKIQGKSKVKAESGRPAREVAGLHKVNVRVKVQIYVNFGKACKRGGVGLHKGNVRVKVTSACRSVALL